MLTFDKKKKIDGKNGELSDMSLYNLVEIFAPRQRLAEIMCWICYCGIVHHNLQICHEWIN